jgi:uncharacterized protein DUF4258
MRYLIDEHTRERMEQRKITDAEIDATIRRPDGRYRDPKGQVVFFRMIDGRIIHVCIWKNRKPMTTRTTWYE